MSSVKVVPNPINNRTINLQVSDLPNGFYRVQVFNSFGQKVMSDQIEVKGNSGTHSIPVDSKLPKGMYYLRIANDAQSFNQSLIIQ